MTRSLDSLLRPRPSGAATAAIAIVGVLALLGGLIALSAWLLTVAVGLAGAHWWDAIPPLDFWPAAGLVALLAGAKITAGLLGELFKRSR